MEVNFSAMDSYSPTARSHPSSAFTATEYTQYSVVTTLINGLSPRCYGDENGDSIRQGGLSHACHTFIIPCALTYLVRPHLFISAVLARRYEDLPRSFGARVGIVACLLRRSASIKRKAERLHHRGEAGTTSRHCKYRGS
jgi:hypothetical protein